MKRKVIIDCDPGIDDSLALMMAIQSPMIEVIAITIVCGNTPVEMGFENAKKVLSHLHRLDIPIYIGASTPLQREYVNALDTHGPDGLGESYLEPIPGYQQAQSALDFYQEILHREQCDVIAIGPLTNLAHLIQTDPKAFSQIGSLISMGGTYKSHGNCSPVAEYNYWCDPHAAHIVFQHMAEIGKKIHMVGLDVTRKIVLTPNLLAYLKRLDEYTGCFVEAITKFYFDFHWSWEHLIGCVINDPLAIAYYLNPSLCDGFDAYIDIETQGISIGQSVVDAYHFYQKPANAHVLTKVDTLDFFKMFFATILQVEPSTLDLLDSLIQKGKE